MPLVDTMNSRLYMGKSKMDKEISELYKRKEIKRWGQILWRKVKESWVDPTEIEPVKVPKYRSLFIIKKD